MSSYIQNQLHGLFPCFDEIPKQSAYAEACWNTQAEKSIKNKPKQTDKGYVTVSPADSSDFYLHMFYYHASDNAWPVQW